MRLLNVSTREVEEFHGTVIPQYAILSHTWGPEEVTLHEMEAIARYRRSQQAPPVHMARSGDHPDTMKLMLLSTMLLAFRGDRTRANQPSALPALTNGSESDEDERGYGRMVPSASPHPFELKAGYAKIAYACGQAEKEGYRYLWADTCCIDKRSSAEMSEAVNSMFGWYQRAAVCYAYLEDVHFDNYTEGYLTWKDHFTNSRWFTRGWTLQELLAPRKLVFYAKGWRLLGTKSALVKHVAKITSIDELTLLEPNLVRNASVAQRMSWAANRTTTKPEDLAYSLLGIFGVNMSIIYGEGENAFLRLQEEIIKRSDDHSIFAWGTLGHDDGHLPHHIDMDDFDYDDDMADTTGIFAKSPQDFAGMEHVVAAPPPTQHTSDYTMTNKGLHIKLFLARPHTASHHHHHHHHNSPTTSPQNHYLAILNCHPEQDPTARLALLLTETPTPNIFLRTRTRTTTLVSAPEVAVSKPKLVYIPNTPAHNPHHHSKLSEEVVLVRAPDLVAPGYDVLDIQARQAVWNREFRSMRLAGVDYSGGAGAGAGAGGGVVYQLAVVTFWNQHLKCGFVVRILVEGASKVVFVDLLQGLEEQGNGDGEEGKGLVEQAKRVWENPETVAVSVPVPGSKGDPSARRTIQVHVVNPVAAEAGEQETTAARTPGAWAFRPGHEVKVSGSVTFTEKWERDYQRTVNAKVERRKKGAIELTMSSMLWQAAPVVRGEELDQPS
ncbi:vegetative incompatibility protein HET-E-1 [Chaetomidium leptoderma]|uniref:Vegetative incompatibility protein HET-E-1 n=1 Tax=Chaetomidium leptoderma TaxID=669021 RepID=A0AAN6ZWB8_9PEZI|nr:vegetative incompatibility protein HET-E-1 [Chaetomidium leptoderma]